MSRRSREDPIWRLQSSWAIAAPGLLDRDAPDTWVDYLGRVWKTPRIRGRLRLGKIPAHGALREHVEHRDGHACVRCGQTEWRVVDHIIARRLGGANHPLNLQTLCDGCNKIKGGLVDMPAERAAGIQPRVRPPREAWV